jgi:hypothetical protein
MRCAQAFSGQLSAVSFWIGADAPPEIVAAHKEIGGTVIQCAARKLSAFEFSAASVRLISMVCSVRF